MVLAGPMQQARQHAGIEVDERSNEVMRRYKMKGRRERTI